jgi:hypothetical protein
MEKKEETINFNFHNTLWKMWRTPSAFFSSDKETSYQNLLRMFVLFYLFYLIIAQVISAVYGEFNAINAMYSIIAGLFISVVLAFVLPGLMYLLLILSGSGKGFFSVYKVGIYALVLWVFYSIVQLFINLAIPFDIQGFQVAITSIQNFSTSTIMGASINFLKDNQGSLVNILLSSIINLHILVFGIKALSHYQKISKVKASIVMVLSAIILLALQIAIMTYISINSATPIV